MARITTKIEPFERDIRLMLDELSPEAASRQIASVARATINEADAINAAALGRKPPHRTFVDGREGAALESVSPRGTIVAEWDLVEDMLEWIGTALVDASPILTGQYRDSHVIVVDGVALEIGQPLPEGWGEVSIMSTVPYARKIERGLSDQAPDGVYQGVAALARRRFGNIAKIRFGYRTPLFGSINTWAGSASAASWAAAHGRRRDAAEWLRRQPAIVLTPYG
jgi:hypothetical protein